MGRIVALVVTFFVVILGAAAIAFLWPNVERPGPTAVGKIDEIKRTLHRTDVPIYSESGKFFIVPYRHEGEDPYSPQGAASHGIMILSARSPHLARDRVYFCQNSGRFESAPDGSKFNLAGERMGGSPAPAGLWRHPIEVTPLGDVLVDTRRLVAQPPLGTDTLRQVPSGASCNYPPTEGAIYYS